MKKFTELLEKYLQPISEKISNQKDLRAISIGLARITPLSIIGSLFFLLANFPIDSYKNMLVESGFQEILLIPYNTTFSLIAVFTVFFITYAYSQNEELDAPAVTVLALVSFFILTPITTNQDGLSYSFTNLGSRGMFLAIIVSLVSTRLYKGIVNRNWVIKMPDGVPPFVEKSFSSLIPFFIISTIMLVISYLFRLTTFGNAHDLIYTMLQKPLIGLGGSFSAFVIAYVLIQIFWWFGIHGMNVVGAVMMPIWLALDAERLAQIAAGEPITTYVGQAFMTALGGPALAVTLTFLLFAKSKQLQAVSKIALPAAIFNIAEPVNYGIPTVLNVTLFLPVAILIPMFNIFVQYIAMITGLVPALTGVQVPQQIPRGLWGFLQGNWQIGILQLLLVVANIAILYPFAKVYDKQLCKREAQLEIEKT